LGRLLTLTVAPPPDPQAQKTPALRPGSSRTRSSRSLVSPRTAPLRDLPQRIEPLAVRRNPGAREPTAVRPTAAPDLDEDPFPEEVSVKVGLVVAGLLSIDPPLVLPSLFHGVQRTLRGGSFREPPGNQIDPQTPRPRRAVKPPP